jgi:putative endopeptidase
MPRRVVFPAAQACVCRARRFDWRFRPGPVMLASSDGHHPPGTRAMKRLILLIPAIILLGSAPATAPTDTEHYLSQFVDSTVSPRNDFFEYSVGGWLNAHPIPPAERSWGIAKVVQEETYDRLIQLSESAATNRSATRGSNTQKIGDFWYAAMDTATIAQQGLTPLADEFKRIDAIRDRPGLLTAIAHLQTIGVDAMCSIALFQDEKNSDRYAVHLYQGGLGMPNRDYYFDKDARSTMLRREYVAHVTRMFGLLGEPETKARADAATVMKLETELAQASRKLEALRDPIANYNAMSVASVSTLTPSIRWRQFLEDGRITKIDTVIVGQPEFFKQVEASLKAHPIADWKTYLKWQTAHAYAAEAGGKYDAENFHFYGTILNGTKEQRPRWKRMLDEEEGYLGDALGQLYVERYFSPRAKARYERLTSEIFDAFRNRIHNLDWMSPETKARALKKLDAVVKKVGYPEKWRDYSAYAVDRSSFLANCVRGNAWRTDYYIAKLHKPVDRTEWEMTPQTYNAYYNPSNNEIVLPAAAFILPGIPDSLVDDALVYAYAGGSTIGHEITHGFDDEGRQFDEKGNLAEWWTPKDEAEFKQRAAKIVRQFNAYVVVDSLHVNGEATQGENIADLGGILLGWDAFTKTEQFRRNQSIGGFTPAQRYFFGWSLSWMTRLRPENLAMRVKTDVHAPSFLRVNGPVSNLPQFYAAFGVRPGDPMYRPDSVRVSIW